MVGSSCPSAFLVIGGQKTVASTPYADFDAVPRTLVR